MPEQPAGGGHHLPSPSIQPFITSLGVALMLFGLVPDARLWRLSLVALGFIIFVLGAAQWLREAIAEYRSLPD